MKIAIISDTHDNSANFNKIIDWLNSQKVKIILHCGDISRQDTIDEAVKNFNGEIKFVRGNADFYLNDIPEKLEIELDGKNIAFVHFPKIAKEMADSGKYNLVFYGHTHKPWEEKVGNCRLVNPGEAAGYRFKPTFAVYDTKTDNLELKILEKL
ncbi:MAG: metallophosphoesterase family protein [Candidatus Staskawiczbacteria bacterium]|nr:metallophosphoesterase family protein [Candidatus Staskawiczbacteria bacterium]